MRRQGSAAMGKVASFVTCVSRGLWGVAGGRSSRQTQKLVVGYEPDLKGGALVPSAPIVLTAKFIGGSVANL